MKKLVALVATITLASTSVVACTPKPVSAEPVAEEFLEGMESRNNDGLAALTDSPSDATAALDATYSGLQAEGLVEYTAPGAGSLVTTSTPISSHQPRSGSMLAAPAR